MEVSTMIGENLHSLHVPNDDCGNVACMQFFPKYVSESKFVRCRI